MAINRVEFTYYGDLLGISNLYRLSSKIAYEKLNLYYNTTFRRFYEYCTMANEVKVEMYSDNLMIWGKNPVEVLKHLSNIYVDILQEGLLLRGAMVKGELKFDPRLTLKNFSKQLPKDDTLARAVGLEKTQKGARLLIENTLAQELFREVPEWLTHDGYVKNVHKQPGEIDVLRRICPTPDNNVYELLYFWEIGNRCSEYRNMRKELQEIMKMQGKEIGEHYKATIDLIDRCKYREQFTLKSLEANDAI
ncbi:MAG: hypothetical protein ABIH66_11315 [bacterium]